MRCNIMVRKGQAAMEFLMTYGWAILVVLAAIGALAYFGVLSPDNFLPSKCTISPEFACTEWKVNTDGTVQLGLQNNLGSTASEINVTLVGPDCPTSTVTVTSVPNGRNFNASGDNLVTFDCGSALGVDDKFQGDLTLTYLESGSSLTHSVTGTLQTKVE